MGFDSGNIILNSENNTYYSGQTISGKLQFQQDKVKTFRGIYVTVKGFGHVHWTTTESRRVNDKTEHYTVNHDADEEYFRVKQYLAGAESGEHNLQPGNHEFPFHCLIPQTCPSSFEGTHGHIRYQIKVVVDRQFKIDQEKKLSIRVIAPLDLNTVPSSQEPIVFEYDDSYCCWCMSSGICETMVKLPVSGYCPGQVMPVEVACTNRSNVTINKIKLALIKHTTFHAHHAPGTKSEEDVLAEIKKGPVPGNTTRNWTVEMLVPDIDVLNVETSRIIDVYYTFKAKVSPSGCHSNTSSSRNITIGSIPLQGYGDNYVNPLQDQMPKQDSISVNMTPNFYPGMNQGLSPYPGGIPPYPGGNPPYSGGNAPYPGGNPPYPGGKSPYLDGSSPYPAGLSPANQPSSGSSYTVPNTPYSTSNSPYSGRKSPHPGGNSPFPGGNIPYPGGNSPYPGGNAPYPGVIQMPLPNQQPVSPALGFVMRNEQQRATMPPLPNSGIPTSSPFAGASAPVPSTPTAETTSIYSTPISPYNPEFMTPENESFRKN